MLERNVFTFVLNISYHVVTLSGFLPVRYDRETQTFRSPAWIRYYSITIVAIFAYSYLNSPIAAIWTTNTIISIVYPYITLASICSLFALQLFKHRTIVSVLNQSALGIHLLNSGLRNAPKWVDYRSAVPRLLLKTVLINALAQWAISGVVRDLLTTTHHLTCDWISVGTCSMAYIMQSIVTNVFFAGMLTSHFYFVRINREVADAMRDAMNVQKNDAHSPYAKQVRFCQISERLDVLAELHQQLTELTNAWSCVHSLQLFGSAMHVFSIVIMQVNMHKVLISIQFLVVGLGVRIHCYF